VSGWVRSCQSADEVGLDAAAAVQATRDGAVGRIATLLLPADTAWGARRPRRGGGTCGGGTFGAAAVPATPPNAAKLGPARCCCWAPAAAAAWGAAAWPRPSPPTPAAG
jgi:hypothetical protein